MRLDEWQKFIESQFLEETIADKSVPKAPDTKTDLKADSQTSLFPDEEPIRLPEEITSEQAEPSPSATVESIDQANTEEQEQVTEISVPRPQPVQTTPRQSGFVVRSVVETPVEGPEPLPAVSPVPFAETLDLDAEIPVFANYLPSKAVEPSPEPVETQAIANLFADESTSGPVSVLLPLTSGFVSALSAPVKSPRTEGDAGSADRRRKRAPHARNVPSENVASGLSSADLWAQVPRHVQTLLALERREEEKEVAQSSYKRPFQEKRAELIARILDPVLSLEDTARLLNVCPTTVRRYTNKGILTHYRKEPERPSENTTERETRQRRFRLSDILTFLETQQSALDADRLEERVAPSRRKRATPPLKTANQE
ncbi:MAG: Helix-turn-helix domain [Chthonomonadales bacterium]|nr:Helix-turn-helix domain [Chthonomonadales bacterium]